MLFHQDIDCFTVLDVLSTDRVDGFSLELDLRIGLVLPAFAKSLEYTEVETFTRVCDLLGFRELELLESVLKLVAIDFFIDSDKFVDESEAAVRVVSQIWRVVWAT